MASKRTNPASIFDDWTGFPDAGAPTKTAQDSGAETAPPEAPGDAKRLTAFLSALGGRDKLSFLEHLAHELTVCTRATCAESSGLTRIRRLEHARRINEVLHRVVLRIRWLRLGKDPWREEEFGEMVFEWIDSDAVLREQVVAGLRRAHEYYHKRGI